MGPAVAGILIGVAVTTAAPGHSSLSGIYINLPEYQLWRSVMVAQITVYISIASYLWAAKREVEFERIGLRDTIINAGVTILVIAVPNLLVRQVSFPLYGQRIRMLFVIATAAFAIVAVTHYMARIFLTFGKVADVDQYMGLHRSSRDLLMVAALVVTLGTIGAGALERSLAATAEASEAYISHLTTGHVLSYGIYFTVVLTVFFTPLLLAERRAAFRISQRAALIEMPDARVDFEERLSIQKSFAEQVVSAFGVLSPLIGVLITRLLG